MVQWKRIEDRKGMPNGVILVTDGNKLYLSHRDWLYRTLDGKVGIPENYGNGAIITHWIDPKHLLGIIPK